MSATAGTSNGGRALTAAVVLLAAASAAAGGGNYLIVTAPDYAGSAPLNQFVAHKTALGFNVATYIVPAGTSNSTLKSYIEGLWGTPAAPDYVLLVGDTSGFSSTANTIPHWTGGGPKSATTDLPYACMDGPTDWFPDLCVGRFSCRDDDMLQDIVDKTITVESGSFPDPGYPRRATLLATDDTSSGAEEVHDWVAANYLTPGNFQVNKIYARLGGSTADITDAVNGGTLFLVYFGHSSSTSWWAPSFGQSNIQSLTNADLYPLVFGFSCSTNHYENDECFGETWQRVANRGAAAYISASTFIYWTQSPWHESQNLEKFFFQSFFVDGIWEVGPAWQAALYRLRDYYGATDIVRDHFEMFSLLGDPALLLPGGCPEAGTLALDRGHYGCEGTMSFDLRDCGLNASPTTPDTASITVASDSNPTGVTVLLTETGNGTARFQGTLTLSTTGAPHTLLVTHGDLLSATYVDADNGQGQQVVVTDTARVDCVAPFVANVRVLDIASDGATVALDADEPVRATVYHGEACGSLTQQAENPTLQQLQAVPLSGLPSHARRYFAVAATDEAGNVTYDDAGGLCYSFVTLPGPVAVHRFDLTTSPGWTVQGQWAFGEPLGHGGSAHGYPDPTSGYTGRNVYGVNLAGDYSTTTGGPYYLTTGPLNLANIHNVKLAFRRWLNTDYEPYAYATVEVSRNGTTWQTIWNNGGGSDITENAWSLQEFDISALADGQPTVYIRWGYRMGNGAYAYSGWNIDDIALWGTVPFGDLDYDGDVDGDDFELLSACLAGPAATPPTGCQRPDLDVDGDVDLADFAEFQPAFGG